MKRRKWWLAWLAQFAAMLPLGVLAALSKWFGVWPENIFAWGVMPVAGMLTAYHATRHGLLNYVAWIAPPLCMWLGNWILYGYSPEPGPALLCALVSLVGAAAGEVANGRKSK